jgi:protein-L-isoaspartate O-methyltransferase
LAKSFEKISSAKLLAPVIAHIPHHPSHILDIGAGTGRDAAWLAALSHTVVAVEPVDALRHAGQAKHTSPNISWVKDTLPDLSQTIALGQQFDVILLCAVWQHLTDMERRLAFASFQRLAAKGGKVIMSIRHGAGALTRPVYPAKVSEVATWARDHGFEMLDNVPTQSTQQQNQQAGVTWNWLVLQT